jgi:hypothetical protein
MAQQLPRRISLSELNVCVPRQTCTHRRQSLRGRKSLEFSLISFMETESRMVVPGPGEADWDRASEWEGEELL